MATRGSPRHRCRTDRLCIFNFRRADDYFHVLLWQYIDALLCDHRGGPSAGYLLRFGGCSDGSLGLRRQAFNGHRLGDCTSLGFGPCQQKTFGLISFGGYDYYFRTTAFVQCTQLLQRWPPAAYLPRPAPRSLLGGRERTPQRLARNPLQPLPCWVHSPPRSSLWISCTVHNWLSTKYDYQTTCTTREGSSLTSSTGLLSRLERQVCWQCRLVQL
jgi:hypothetical protein